MKGDGLRFGGWPEALVSLVRVAMLGRAGTHIRLGIARPGTPTPQTFTEMYSGSEEGSYLRLIDFCVSLNSRRRFGGWQESLVSLVRVAMLGRAGTHIRLGIARAGTPTPQYENNYFTEICSGSEAGSYLRLIDFCITQL